MWKIILKYPGIFSTRVAAPTTKLQSTSEILSFQIALAAARAMMWQYRACIDQVLAGFWHIAFSPTCDVYAHRMRIERWLRNV